MSTSFDTHGDLTTNPAAEAEGLAPAAPRPAAQERHPFSALPAGWAVIGRCRFGTGGPGPHATGCYALAHPEVGVALIDVAPDATPNAEARLRRALTAAEFWPDFPGSLPVVHERVDGTALRSLAWVLQRGFAALPALTVPGGTAWIEGVQRAMAADPAWELPGQPKTAPDTPPLAATGDTEAEAEPAAAPRSSRSARPRRWGRLAALPLAFAATFAVGVVSGFVLLDSPAPVPPASPVVAAAPQAPAAITPAPTVAAAPEAAPRAGAAQATAALGAAPAVPATAPPVEASRPAAEAAAPGAVPSLATAAAAPKQAAPLSPPPQPALPAAEAPSQAAPFDVAALQQAAGPAAAGGSAPSSSPLETRLSHGGAAAMGAALPMAPPRAPAPPVRVNSPQRSSRPAPVIDRACSQALFRFQQGERLTAAEQSFVRTGCSTARR